MSVLKCHKTEKWVISPSPVRNPNLILKTSDAYRYKGLLKPSGKVSTKPGQRDIPRKVVKRIPWESSKVFEAKYLNALNNHF